MKTEIFMVRHAESPFIHGEERTRGLSEEGLQAAVKVADLLDHEEIHAVISSTYVRAKQTVQVLAARKSLPIQEYEELRERPIKSLNDKAAWEEILTAIEFSFTDHDYALAGGETTREAQQRAMPIIQELLAKYAGKNIVIDIHGNIMTIIMNYYDPSYGYEFWSSAAKPDIYRMIYLDGQIAHIARMWK